MKGLNKVIRCNMCDRLFSDDNDLSYLFDINDSEWVNGCPDCKTDNYLMDMPYQPPDTNDNIYYLIALTIGGLFALVMFLVLFGCSTPIGPDKKDGPVIQRPCSTCHIIIDGKVMKPKNERIE